MSSGDHHSKKRRHEPRDDPYALVETIKGPELPGEVVVTESADELIDLVAADLVIHAENCVREFGDFHLALTGGPATEALYRRLMYDPNYRRLPWQRTHLWLVKERCVELGSRDSLFRTIDETIVDHSGIPREQVHPIFAMNEAADEEYEKELKEALGWRERGQDRLDYVLLVLSRDGLQSNAIEKQNDNRLIQFASHDSSSVSQHVVMTDVLINSARFIAVFATGKSTAETVRELTKDGRPRNIDPINGELKWYLDGAACGYEC